MKKKFSYECMVCHKKKQSVDPTKNFCNDCIRWSTPGKGQESLFLSKTNLNSVKI